MTFSNFALAEKVLEMSRAYSVRSDFIGQFSGYAAALARSVIKEHHISTANLQMAESIALRKDMGKKTSQDLNREIAELKGHQTKIEAGELYFSDPTPDSDFDWFLAPDYVNNKAESFDLETELIEGGWIPIYYIGLHAWRRGHKVTEVNAHRRTAIALAWIETRKL